MMILNKRTNKNKMEIINRYNNIQNNKILISNHKIKANNNLLFYLNLNLNINNQNNNLNLYRVLIN